MNIVHLSTTDSGGAFKATIRISESLGMQSVDSTVLVRTKYHNSKTIEVMNSSVKRVCSKIRNGINLLFSSGDVVTDLLGADVSSIQSVRDADIIILHWVNSFISAKSIQRISKLGKKIIWVMHDMWAFTGGCHYDGGCGRYVEDCGCCPILKSGNIKDRTYRNLRQKEALYSKQNITFVALSHWELERAQNSRALQGCNVVKIWNPLDVNIFQPLDRLKLRFQKMNTSKKVILFGASRAFEDEVKGFRYLIEALKRLDKTKYCAVCFGGSEKANQQFIDKFEITYLGQIEDENELAEWYNIADVFVAPSLQETFCYTVCEALACGTPVAAFAIGGILDQVEHQKNGYLAEMRNSEDLARGIEYCVNNRDKLTTNARDGVLKKNTYDLVGKEYLALCKSILNMQKEDKNE